MAKKHLNLKQAQAAHNKACKNYDKIQRHFDKLLNKLEKDVRRVTLLRDKELERALQQLAKTEDALY